MILWLLMGTAWGRAGNHPNVLLITVDTLRADHLAPYGYGPIKTLATDGLAEDGVLFETVISQAPMTLPSHATILTGTYPNYHGVRDVVGHLRSNIPTLAEAFKSRGYSTAAFVGSSVLSARWGLNRGFDIYFDRFDSPGGRQVDLSRLERPADRVVESALEWLGKRKKSPFLLWIHLYDPHDPYMPPEPYRSQYKDRLYDGEIAFADAQLVRLLDYLKAKGLFDPMTIILTADHGEALGQHQEAHHGFYIYEESIRVPLIIKMPNSRFGGRRIPALVRTTDIMPTVLQICSIPVPATVQGESLLGLISGKRARGPGAAYSETLYPKIHFGWSPLYAWRTSRYQFIQAPKPELYDLSSDGKEEHNIYDKQQALAHRLESDLDNHRRKYDSTSQSVGEGEHLDPETMEKLKSLGYISFSAGSLSTDDGQLPDPKDKIGLYNQLNRAIRYSREGSREKAIKLMEEVARIEPTMPLVHFLVGREYFEKGWFLKAIECFRETIRLNPASDVAAFQLARSYYRAGYPEKAEVGLRKLVAVEKNHFAAYHLIASILGKRKDFKGAIKAELRVLEIRPDHIEAHNNLGSYYYQLHDLDHARKHYSRAVELNPNWPLPQSNLTLVFLSGKEWESAEKSALRSIRLEPGEGLGYYYLGQALEGQGRRDEADAAFRKARQLNPRLTPPPDSRLRP